MGVFGDERLCCFGSLGLVRSFHHCTRFSELVSFLCAAVLVSLLVFLLVVVDLVVGVTV